MDTPTDSATKRRGRQHVTGRAIGLYGSSVIGGEGLPGMQRYGLVDIQAAQNNPPKNEEREYLKQCEVKTRRDSSATAQQRGGQA